LPRLASARRQSYTLNALALAYRFSGEPGRAEPLFRRAVEIDEQEKDGENVAVTLCNLSAALRHAGHLRASETAVHRALVTCREQGDRLREGLSLSFRSRSRRVRGSLSISAHPVPCAAYLGCTKTHTKRRSHQRLSRATPPLAQSTPQGAAARATCLDTGAR